MQNCDLDGIYDCEFFIELIGQHDIQSKWMLERGDFPSFIVN